MRKQILLTILFILILSMSVSAWNQTDYDNRLEVCRDNTWGNVSSSNWYVEMDHADYLAEMDTTGWTDIELTNHYDNETLDFDLSISDASTLYIYSYQDTFWAQGTEQCIHVYYNNNTVTTNKESRISKTNALVELTLDEEYGYHSNARNMINNHYYDKKTDGSGGDLVTDAIFGKALDNDNDNDGTSYCAENGTENENLQDAAMNDFTVSWWYKNSHSVTQDSYLIDHEKYSLGWQLYYSDGAQSLRWDDPSGPGTTGIEDDTSWHFYTMVKNTTYNGSHYHYEFYKDGVLDSRDDFASLDEDIADTPLLFFGEYGSGSSCGTMSLTDDIFEGTHDNLMIWNYSLDSTDVLEYYNAFNQSLYSYDDAVQNNLAVDLTFTPTNGTQVIAETLDMVCQNTTDPGHDLNFSFYKKAEGEVYWTLLYNGTNNYYNYSTTSGDYELRCRADNGTAYSNYTESSLVEYINLNLTTCSAPAAGQMAIFNLSFLDEQDDSLVNADLESTWRIWDSDPDNPATFHLNLNNVNNTLVCMADGNFKTYAHFNYDATGYDYRDYYLINATLSDTSETLNLYLLNITLGTGISFEVTDESRDPLSDYYIVVQRYDLATDTYKNVAMGNTDDDGTDYIYLRQYDAWYRFLVQNDTEVVFQSDLRKVTTSSLSFQIVETLFYETLDLISGISTTLNYDNVTGVVEGDYVSGTGENAEMNLKVWKHTPSSSSLVCENDTVGVAGTLTCDISSEGNGTFIASMYTEEAAEVISSALEIQRNILDLFEDELGIEGIALTAIAFIAIVTTSLVVGSPALTLGVGILTLFIMAILGFLNVSMAVLVGIIVIGGVIFSLIKK